MRTFEQALVELEISSEQDRVLIERAALVGYFEFGRGAVRYEYRHRCSIITYVFQKGYPEWLKRHFVEPREFEQLMHMMSTYNPHSEYVVFADCHWDGGGGCLQPKIMPVTILKD
ncbi:MAG: hypothetical protein SAK29_23025 [Scytonema sp. PMC 1069.18]|nr:hypothetical protein [Scytonema sp. PMC 1069.18]MEC4885621.1 hypothetical protein [Scytonema sp. PMC 1070.18]